MKKTSFSPTRMIHTKHYRNMTDIIYYYKVNIADKKIEIECCYKRVFLLCRDYLSTFDAPDFVVRSSKSEIREEGARELGVDADYINDVNWKEGVAIEFVDAESIIILRKIADEMLNFGVLLVHGAAIAVENKCFIFIAPSGTGKTTHVKKWLKMYPDAYVVNGDKPFVDVYRKIAYGSPWCGKESMHTNTGVPVAGIVYLEQGEHNRISDLSFREMLPYLLRQCYIPAAAEQVEKACKLIGELNNIPFYKLTCNMDDEAAVISYEKLMNNR